MLYFIAWAVIIISRGAIIFKRELTGTFGVVFFFCLFFLAGIYFFYDHLNVSVYFSSQVKFSVVVPSDMICHIPRENYYLLLIMFTQWKSTWGPFYWRALILIPAWISNHMPSKSVCQDYSSFSNFKGCTVEVGNEWLILSHTLWYTESLLHAGIEMCPC